jgi:hypothetical protein
LGGDDVALGEIDGLLHGALVEGALGIAHARDLAEVAVLVDHERTGGDAGEAIEGDPLLWVGLAAEGAGEAVGVDAEAEVVDEGERGVGAEVVEGDELPGHEAAASVADPVEGWADGEGVGGAVGGAEGGGRGDEVELERGAGGRVAEGGA